MTDVERPTPCYRKLSEHVGEVEARNLIDRVQVLALTRPEIVRDLETWLARQVRLPPTTHPARR
jgi:hypothetical protein